MATYYVDAANGANTNDGSSGAPWKTISHAAASGRNLQPGDTVIVKAGTYNEGVNIQHSGSEAGYITFKSEVWGGAKVKATGQKGIKADGRSYLRIEGFDVSGANGGGIVIDRAIGNTAASQRSHHIEIVGNISHDNGTQGIGVYRTDWVLIEDNIVYGNCNGSGSVNALVVLMMQKFGPDSTPGYRMIVRGNWVYDNGLLIGSTDSGGIMIDQDAQGQAIQWNVEDYSFPRLVENNVCFHNGGPGLIVLAASLRRTDYNPGYRKNMDILARYNTLYGNARKPDAGLMTGNLTVRASDAMFEGNVIVADDIFAPEAPAIAVVSLPNWPITHSGIKWHSNVTYNLSGSGSGIKSNTGNSGNVPVNNVNGNKLGVDPKFVDAATQDFRPAVGSPLIDAGTSVYGVPETDFAGNERTGTPDIGAYAYLGPVVPSEMTPGSTVFAGMWLRGATTDIDAEVGLGGNFVKRNSRSAIQPANWIGDTGNTVQDAFAEITKTLPGNSLGAIAIVFSMKPET